MEDSLSYLNAVSQASSALNQVNALREQATMDFERKKEQLGAELELPSEISITTAGGYLGKKALGYVSDKFGSTISDVAGKVGISEETVGKALSGDISGAIEQGSAEVTQAGEGLVAGAESMIGQTLSGITTTAETMAGQLASAGESVISEATQSATGILGRVGSSLENINVPSIPSINPESNLNDIYSQGLEDLRNQAGIDESMFREYTNVSLNEARPFSYNSPQQAGQDIEMTDMASVAQPSAEATAEAGAGAIESTGTAVAESTGTAVAESTGTAVAETAGEVAGAEVAGASLDATGILAPLGAVVGLIGGLVGFFTGHHDETETPPPPPFAYGLNPSSQFGAESA